MFMRETEGVYQFGSKRVAVKVDKDKINIRVGGGFLSIDEFLDQYTPAELEKIERKDPLKRFSEKVAVQKTIVGKEVRESSPVTQTRSGSPIKGSPMKYWTWLVTDSKRKEVILNVINMTTAQHTTACFTFLV